MTNREQSSASFHLFEFARCELRFALRSVLVAPGAMFRHILFAALLMSLAACAAPTKVTEETITATAAQLDFGDYTSSTLTTKAWEALDEKNYPAVLAYTRECVRRYGEEGRKMNAGMSGFAPEKLAADKWALNDVGTSLYIMGSAYAELEMYAEAADAYQQLATDFRWSQCWDPKGWFWHPAEGAAEKAEKYRRLAG